MAAVPGRTSGGRTDETRLRRRRQSAGVDRRARRPVRRHPVGLIAVSRARFGSADPLAGVDLGWFGDDAASSLTRPIADDTVIDALIRLSLCVAWIAIAVIVVTTALEVVHMIRHRGLPTPSVRGLGWAQRIARFIAVGLIVLIPLSNSSPSIATSLAGRMTPTLSREVAASAARRVTAVASADRREVHAGHCTHGGWRVDGEPRRPARRIGVLDRRTVGRCRRGKRDGHRRVDRRRQSRRHHGSGQAIHDRRIHRGRLGTADPRTSGHGAGRSTRRGHAAHRSAHLHRASAATRCGTSPTSNSAIQRHGRRSGRTTPATRWAAAARSTTPT